MDEDVWQAAALLRKASAEAGAGDRTAAAAAATFALSRPGLPATLRRLAAQVLAICDQHHAALAAFLSADRLCPGQAGITSEIAACCAVLGDLDQSRAWLRKAATTDPSEPAALREWLLLECRDGDGDLVVATLAALREAGFADRGLAVECAQSLERRGCAGQAAAARETGRPHGERGDVGASLACLSLPKTSSMALASALKDAGFADVLHLHFFGPMGLRHRQGGVAARGAPVPPMLRDALDLSARLADRDHVFRFVTCMRDPLARIVSQAFENAEPVLAATGVDITRDAAAVVDWYEQAFGEDVAGAWLDDSFKAPFGFDFRLHPFDRERRSLRYETRRLKLLILRQEDSVEARQRELGWLVDRPSVPISRVNSTNERSYASRYRAMVETFVAPQSWIDRFYASDATRHFYTVEEIATFQARWSARKELPT